MADAPKYSSIIDEFLSDREPDWKDLGLKDAQSSGKDWLDRTHEYTDVDFMDEIAEGASHHTNVPPTSKGATLTNRLLDKENAAPRLGANRTAQTRTAGGADDDASLFDEVTESLEEAAKGGKVEKKHRSDAEIQRYVRQLLNQGVPPAKVASQLKKLAEIELFNHSMTTRYLQDNAGLLGIAYMEPNTFMDKNNPNYERTASSKTAEPYGLFNTRSEMNQLEGEGGVLSTISNGDRVTIRTPHGQERTGKAVMFNSSQRCWVLNFGGKHGTPGTANEENIIRVKKAPRTASSKTAYDNPQDCSEGCDDKDGDYCCGGGFAYNDKNEWIGQPCPCQECHSSSMASMEPIAETHGEEWDTNDDPMNLLDTEIGQKMLASSQDCVRQAKAWKSAGITPRAKSVKQITACEGCSYFKTNSGSKTCSLYGLPVVGNSLELNAVVNRMTAGVPKEQKKAALVQIANRQPERIAAKEVISPQVHQSSFTTERKLGLAEAQHFSASTIQKLHTAGHSLKAICTAAEKKYGPLEVSKGVREFIASLRKEKGKIIVASVDADYLKKIGIHNEAIVGASKCASCKAHSGKEAHKAASTEMVTRTPDTFVQATVGHVRSTQTKAASTFDSGTVSKAHAAGHSVEKIFKAASAKYGSAQASKAIRDWAHNLKNTNTKIALSQIDCTTLKKMGVKLSSKNAIIGAEKCGSCGYRNGMHCGLTGGTLLSFPGMIQITSNKKVAAGAPEDGRSMLQEFDLMDKVSQNDIDMRTDRPDDVQF